jgi:glycosyltransferase involved in cell wall biosynthesis
MENIAISMVICTRDRALQLSSVLESVCKLDVPQGLSWELIVIDNGSSDNTGQVVASFADRLPVTCVMEEQPGLSNARNRAVDVARGEYICWTDDDVVIDPGWLAAYAEAFKRHPEAALFGGRVIPLLEKPTPDWFERAKYDWPLNNLLAYRDFGDEIVALSFSDWMVPWGANYAIRTMEQKRHRYNPRLGVSPLHKRVGEETDVMYRIFKDGANGWWVPNSQVQHIIPPKRQTLQYLYDYSFLVGETFAYMRDKYPVDNYLLANGVLPPEYNLSRFRLYRRGVNRFIKYLFATVMKKDNRLSELREVGYFFGAASYKKKL